METNVKILLGIVLLIGVVILVIVFSQKNNVNNTHNDQLLMNQEQSELMNNEDSEISSSSSLSQSMEPSQTITTAILKTSMGDITIELDRKNTPNTAENFITLAQSGFYNGTKFHRIIPDFMIQGGDPLTKDDSVMERWGTGGPDYRFADEIKPTNKNSKGTISMANAGPNTNGSQFFINVLDNPHLDRGHTVFGKVIAGYDVAEKISKVVTLPNGRPLQPVVIYSLEIK